MAPLDWGLGHATRCVPLIHKLLQHQCRVVLAASGRGLVLLQQEFPSLPVLPLPGYEISYASGGWGLAAKIVAQIPKLLSAINKEHLWLQKVVKEHRIDAVISDNRYGLYHPAIPSVFLTHQLCIETPFGLGKNSLQTLNYSYINRFAECWVPDAEGNENLAGSLSHPATLPAIPVRYTGTLSRFGHLPANAGNEIVFLLSGPEPSRTRLEEQLVAELRDFTQPFVLLRGLPGETGSIAVNGYGTVHNHLPAYQLGPLLAGARLVIGRSGYSTVMDLAALQKRSILLPTPGQTEQEYLAGHLMQSNFALCIPQKKFRLKAALELAGAFRYCLPQPAEGSLNKVVGDFVTRLTARAE